MKKSVFFCIISLLISVVLVSCGKENETEKVSLWYQTFSLDGEVFVTDENGAFVFEERKAEITDATSVQEWNECLMQILRDKPSRRSLARDNGIGRAHPFLYFSTTDKNGKAERWSYGISDDGYMLLVNETAKEGYYLSDVSDKLFFREYLSFFSEEVTVFPPNDTFTDEEGKTARKVKITNEPKVDFPFLHEIAVTKVSDDNEKITKIYKEDSTVSLLSDRILQWKNRSKEMLSDARKSIFRAEYRLQLTYETSSGVFTDEYWIISEENVRHAKNGTILEQYPAYLSDSIFMETFLLVK